MKKLIPILTIFLTITTVIYGQIGVPHFSNTQEYLTSDYFPLGIQDPAVAHIKAFVALPANTVFISNNLDYHFTNKQNKNITAYSGVNSRINSMKVFMKEHIAYSEKARETKKTMLANFEAKKAAGDDKGAKEEKRKGNEEIDEILNAAGQAYYNARSSQVLSFPFFDYKFRKYKTAAGTEEKAHTRIGKSRLTELFYNGYVSNQEIKVATSSILTVDFDGKGASLYSEILTDYLGPFRFSLLTTISKAEEVDQDSLSSIDENVQADAIQKLLTSGGNFGLQMSAPLFTINGGKTFQGGVIWNTARISTDLPKLSEVDDSPTVQFESGFQAYTILMMQKGKIGLYGNYRLGVITGDKNYRELLGEDVFALNQFTAGVMINKSIRIGVSWFVGGDFVKENFSQHSLSVSFVP